MIMGEEPPVPAAPDAAETTAAKGATETAAADEAQEAKETEGDAAGSAGDEPVRVAGHTFPNRDGVQAYVRSLQEAFVDNEPLSSEHALFMFHLTSFLPNFESKLTAPCVGFKYGPHGNGGLKCFFMLRSDGTQEAISVKKCLDGLMIPKVAGLAGTKRPREEAADEGPAKKKDHAMKIRPGCVLLITDIPNTLVYKVVREAIEEKGEEGDVRFVELLNAKEVKKKPKGKGKEGKAKAEPAEPEKPHDGLPARARVRFGDAEVAAKVAKEMKEINGHAVTTRILEGTEEREFWDNLLERADKKRAGEGKKRKK